jgi:hypothetical protein
MLGRLLAASAALVLLAGCYNVGVVPPTGITSVTVPFFRNNTFPMERDLEYDLTREVRIRLEQQTALRLVSSENEADAVLEGTLNSFRESVAAEDALDRAVRSYAFAEVSIRFRRSGPDGEVLFADTWQERTAFLSGAGRESARQTLVQRIADRVLAVAVNTWELE